MPHRRTRNCRRLSRSRAVMLSHRGDACEQRQLLTAANPLPVAADALHSESGEQEITPRLVEVTYNASSGGWNLQIDAVVQSDDDLRAFATAYPPSGDTMVTQAFEQISDRVSVMTSSGSTSLQQIVRHIDDPGPELNEILATDSAQLLFTRPDSQTNAWNQIAPQNPAVKLTIDAQDAPDTIDDLVLLRESQNDNVIQFYWDEFGPDQADAVQPHFRRYDIIVSPMSGFGWPQPVYRLTSMDAGDIAQFWPYPGGDVQSNLLMRFDETHEVLVDGEVRSFGGSVQTKLVPGVYSVSVRKQIVPLVESGLAEFEPEVSQVNVLSTPWSNWSTPMEFTVLPAGQDILTVAPGATTTQHPKLKWGPLDDAVSYELWLNSRQTGSMVLNVRDLQEIELIPDASLSWGDYRYWVRAIREDGTRTSWSAGRDFTLRAPRVQIHRVESTIDRTPTIKWNPQADALSYHLRIRNLDRVRQARSISFISPAEYQAFIHLVQVSVPASQSEFKVSEPLTAGRYSVTVTAEFADGVMGHKGYSSFTLDEPGRPLLTQGGRTVHWESRPDVESTDVWIAYLGSAQPAEFSASPDWKYLVRKGLTGSSIALPDNAPHGDYRAWIRYRYPDDGQRTGTTEWSTHTNWSLNVHHQPSGLTLQYDSDKELLRWTAYTQATGTVTYDVLVAVVDPQGRSTFQTEIHDLETTQYSLSDLENRYPPGVIRDRLRFWVRAVDSVGPQQVRTDWSEPIVVTLSPDSPLLTVLHMDPPEIKASTEPVFLRWLRPTPSEITVVTRTPREVPSAPKINSLWSQPGTGQLSVNAFASLPSDPLLPLSLVNAAGDAVDMEFISIYEYSITDIVTGQKIRLSEPTQAMLHDYSGYRSQPFWSRAHRTAKNFNLGEGVYQVQVRVRHFPVLLAQREVSNPWYYILHPGVAPEAPSPRQVTVNLEPTPWSAWGAASEVTVLPAGESILPYGPAATLNRQSQFNWGPVPGAALYELWVQNRATGQRVIHQIVGNDLSFTPEADLPTGKYLWWVRPVFSQGRTAQWSSPQHREVFTESLQVELPSHTVDATPRVSWTSQPSAVSYTVEVVRSSDQQLVYRSHPLQGTTHRISQQLANGEYEVWVRAEFADGSRSAPGIESRPGQFQWPTMQIGSRPELSITRNSRLISWDAVHGATRYEIWVERTSGDGRSTRVLHDTHVFETHAELPADTMNAPGDSLQVWVRAIRDEAGTHYTGFWSHPLQIAAPEADVDSLWSAWELQVASALN